MRRALELEVRLAYYDRILKTLPEGMQAPEALVMPAEAPGYEFEYESGSTSTWMLTAKSLKEHFCFLLNRQPVRAPRRPIAGAAGETGEIQDAGCSGVCGRNAGGAATGEHVGIASTEHNAVDHGAVPSRARSTVVFTLSQRGGTVPASAPRGIGDARSEI